MVRYSASAAALIALYILAVTLSGKTSVNFSMPSRCIRPYTKRVKTFLFHSHTGKTVFCA